LKVAYIWLKLRCFFSYLKINMTYSLDTVVAWAKRRGFVYPGSDIYG
jgi:hypothetical protein